MDLLEERFGLDVYLLAYERQPFGWAIHEQTGDEVVVEGVETFFHDEISVTESVIAIGWIESEVIDSVAKLTRNGEDVALCRPCFIAPEG